MENFLKILSQRRELKEKNCFAFENKHFFKNHDSKPEKLHVTMPDGHIHELYNEFGECVEALFDPLRFHLEGLALPDLIISAIENSPLDSRKTLYQNVALCGGTSMIPNVKFNYNL